jgi:hypothetical protein
MLSVKIKSEMLDSYSEVNILSGTGVNEKYFENKLYLTEFNEITIKKNHTS